jgi:hypothetical protein
MPATLLCPFCSSGLRWNDCNCTFAKKAQIGGMLEARKLFAVSLGGKRAPTNEIRGNAIAPTPRLSAKRNAKQTAAEPSRQRPAGERPAPSPVEGTIAPPGVCPWCDNRRQANTRIARERRAKQQDQPE